MGHPESIDLERHQELHGRRREVWSRRVFLAAIAIVCALGVANVFGQGDRRDVVDAERARLAVEAPERLRGGLIDQLTVQVLARRTIAEPSIVLDRGWVDSVTVNTVSPEPAEQSNDGDLLVLSYDEIAAGDSLIVRMEYQVNPENVGSAPQDVVLTDGGREIARVDRTLVVFP